ncbi:MAG: O-antigen ligase family protein, partial [Elusimicrobiota bacterium]
RAVIVRIDDILIIAVFLMWLVRNAVHKEVQLFVNTPLNRPMLFYTVICIISSALGIIRGDIDPRITFFYVMKYIEYLLLFFLVVNVVESESQLKTMLIIFFTTACIVVLYSYYLIGQGVRPYAPFDIERGVTETATLGGYFLLVLGLTLGMLAYEKQKKLLLFFTSLFFLILPPLIQTQSRASYFGFAGLVITFLILAKKRKVTFLFSIIGGLLFLNALFPSYRDILFKRMKYTVEGNFQVTTYVGKFNLRLEESAAARVNFWNRIFEEFLPKHPLLGKGVSRLPVEGQIPLVIGETGVLGLVAFFWMLIVIWKETKKLYITGRNEFEYSISLGFLIAFVAIFCHSLTVNTFIIIRIMEPFWLLTGIIMVARKIQMSQGVTK